MLVELCVNRKQFPKELITKATVNNRFYDYRSSGPLLASVWVDKRSIYFVSTFHSAEAPSSAQQPFVKRRRLDGTQQDIACPPVLPDYQEFMRGVDRGDQLHTYYNIGRRSRKWWKRIFFYIVECEFACTSVFLEAVEGAVEAGTLLYRPVPLLV